MVAPEPDDPNLNLLILGLTKHFGHVPTEQEIIVYLFGTNEQREDLFNNKGLNDG